MEKKSISIILSILLFSQLNAQKIWEDRSGCVRGQANIGAGWFMDGKYVAPYINGDIEYFLHKNVSLNGEAWFSLKQQNPLQPNLAQNHSIFWGLGWHMMNHSRFDPYITLSPGISIAMVRQSSESELKPKLFPVMSMTAGFNYYVGSIFNLFVKVRPVMALVRDNSLRGNELKFTAGLGWNIRILKRKPLWATVM